MMKNSFFVPGNVPSLKNSKVATSRGVFPSKTCRKYLQGLGVKSYKGNSYKNYKNRENKFEKIFSGISFHGPVHCYLHFVRDSKRKFDFHNAVQIVADLLVAHGVIADDDIDHFLPFPWEINGSYFSYDKEFPGVHILFGSGMIKT